ncbi:MAG: hypothetical protein M1834_007870 [Cirrosporium novae-zelandiae]|nr:MAG: hypothetical protein M1834_007870 [Cirrosporium novae-zelandiae]
MSQSTSEIEKTKEHGSPVLDAGEDVFVKDPIDPEKGPLADLEVDVSKVLEEGENESITVDSDHSPYPEVRAVVSEQDEPSMPVNTLRMWLVGIVFTIIGSGVNEFFFLRYPSVHIVSLVAELLAYPCGVFLAKTLPLTTIRLGPFSFCVNPDRRFNIKEHAVITIMANVSYGTGGADATNIIQAAKFYGIKLKTGFNVMIVLVCQLMGFGVAGLAAKWIVEPAAMIWPSVLSNCALLTTLHSRANAVASGWKISRLRFFFYVMAGAFWIVPNNVIVNQLFGFNSGLGLSPITFDWSMIAYNTNPLLSPAWAAINVFLGFVFAFWVIVPAIYYTNTWFTAYLPLMTADVYDNTGSVYDTTKVLTAGGLLDVEKYKNYSPPYLPATFAFVYGLSFASITSVLVHVYLWHATEIWEGVKGTNKLDIHGRLMCVYKKVPWYWFAAITVVIFAMACAMVEAYDTNLPIYGVVLALVVPIIYMIPCGIIQAITNVNASQLNVLSEFIGGYLFAGKPIANMVFKILSTDVVGNGLYFAQDMKIGHYLKIPPRTLFFAQGGATIIGALTQTGVVLWSLGHIDNVCSEDQADGFSCPNGRTVWSSSVIWGLVGPGRMYSAGKIYSGLNHFFWIGVVMPVITWLLYKYTKKPIWKLINWPLIFVGTYNVPPATGVNYSSWALVNIIFNYWIKKRWRAWWSKYNYVLAAALDTGLALSGLVIFLCVSYPGGSMPDWWGNTVWQNTADGNSVAWKAIPENGTFGYTTWS